MDASIPRWWSEPLRRHGVEVVQRKLLMPVNGIMDNSFHMVVQGWQRRRGLPVTGVVDEATARLLGESVEYQGAPTWWTENLGLDDNAVLRYLDQVGKDHEWILRLQGNNGISPHGMIDVETAWLIERDNN